MPLTVLLYRAGRHGAGRNLMRCYRTCHSFGVPRIVLVDCPGVEPRGNPYSARGTVAVETADAFPAPQDGLALRCASALTLAAVDWSRVRWLALGGENDGLPRRVAAQEACIPTASRLCLTMEAALAIALYAWREAVGWA